MQLSALPPKQFKFTSEHETMFRELINTICNNAKTYFPDASKPFFVQTDASNFCAAGRLYQKDNSENELLIAAVSRTFTKTEIKYSTHKKEALALNYTLRSMDFYIRFADDLTILVDCKALLFIRLAREHEDILLRFSIELSKYDAKMVHVPGAQNEISDLLSRQHKDIQGIEENLLKTRTISQKTLLQSLTH